MNDQSFRAQLEQEIQKRRDLCEHIGGIGLAFDNLLAIILGYAQLALDEIQEDSKSRHYLLEIQSAGIKAAAALRQLFELRRAYRDETPTQ